MRDHGLLSFNTKAFHKAKVFNLKNQSTKILWKKGINLARTSTTRVKRKGDGGSPCCRL